MQTYTKTTRYKYNLDDVMDLYTTTTFAKVLFCSSAVPDPRVGYTF